MPLKRAGASASVGVGVTESVYRLRLLSWTASYGRHRGEMPVRRQRSGRRVVGVARFELAFCAVLIAFDQGEQNTEEKPAAFMCALHFSMSQAGVRNLRTHTPRYPQAKRGLPIGLPMGLPATGRSEGVGRPGSPTAALASASRRTAPRLSNMGRPPARIR